MWQGSPSHSKHISNQTFFFSENYFNEYFLIKLAIADQWAANINRGMSNIIIGLQNWKSISLDGWDMQMIPTWYLRALHWATWTILLSQETKSSWIFSDPIQYKRHRTHVDKFLVQFSLIFINFGIKLWKFYEKFSSTLPY